MIAFPRINGVLTLDDIAAEKRKVGGAVRLRVESAGSYPETRVLAIEEDGTEHEIRCVERIEFTIEAGPELARARITFSPVDVDVTATPEVA